MIPRIDGSYLLIRELLPEVVESMERAAGDGRLVVFLGSGASMKAGYPDWLGLMKRFHAALENDTAVRGEFVEGMGSLMPDMGLDVLDVLMRTHLPQIKDIYRVIFPKQRSRYKPTEFSRRLAALNSAKFLTPNYDFCFQSSARSIGLLDLKEMSLGNLDANDFQNGSVPTICQIHGTAEQGIETLVLTRTQYNRHYRDSTMLPSFLNQIFLHNAVIFAGFGPKDEYINYLLNQTNAYAPNANGLARVAIYGCRPGEDAKAEALAYVARQQWNINVLHYEIQLDATEENHDRAIDLIDRLGVIVGVRTALPVSSDTGDALSLANLSTI